MLNVEQFTRLVEILKWYEAEEKGTAPRGVVDWFEYHELKGQATDEQIIHAYTHANAEQRFYQRDLDLMDTFDGEIHDLLCSLAGGYIDRDIDDLGEVRDAIIEQLVLITGKNEYAFYPFIVMESEPTPKPSWGDIYSRALENFLNIPDHTYLDEIEVLMAEIELDFEEGIVTDDLLRETLVDTLRDDLGRVKRMLQACGEFVI